MPMEIGDLVVATLRGTLYGQRVMTSYGFRVYSTINAGDTRASQDAFALALSTDTGTNLVGTYLACTTDALTINEIWVQRVRPIRMRKSVLGVALTGGIITPPGTPNVAAVVTRKSDLGNRDSISNLHLPGVPLNATYNLDGVWTVAYKALLDAHAFESYDTINVTLGGEVIRYKGVIINAPGAPTSHQEITAHSINDKVRTMRRRTVGLGE